MLYCAKLPYILGAPYLKVNYKAKHLAIIDNTIDQSICTYTLVHTNRLSYINVVYVSKLLKMLQ